MKDRYKKNILQILVFSILLMPCAAQGLTALAEPFSENPLEQILAEGVTVDLREPVYSDGVLSTTQGGVISTPDIRIQALSITYTNAIIDGSPTETIQAQGCLMVEYGDHLFIGESMEYDFLRSEGVVYQARGAIEPWYIGGQTVYLCPSGEYIAYDAFITTSANRNTEWEVCSEKVIVNQNSRIRASNVQFRFVNLPLLWIPSWSGNLKTMWRMPIRYHARWSGRLGPRVGMSYQFWGNEEWQANALVDYSFLRGFGAGIETDYRQLCGPRSFFTRSYIASDSSVADPDQQERYRISGVYHDEIGSSYTIDLTYDKLSDKYMATDYYIRSFQSRAIGRSELSIKQQTPYWKLSLLAHARLNDFQSVKQELPTLSGSLRPIDLFCSSIISETCGKASYLSFRYDKELPDVLNYEGTRLSLGQRLYRPISHPFYTITPEAQLIAIHYGDNPKGSSADQIATGLGCTFSTDLYRTFSCYKHNINPYLSYQVWSASSNPITDHYLFDIDDGWTALSLARIGVRQYLYYKDLCSSKRWIFADIYTIAFPDQCNREHSIPYLYGSCTWYTNDHLRYLLDLSYDTARGNFAYYNLACEYTIHANLALRFEFRHRTAYSWRKVDYENYFIDAYYTEKDLIQSSVSDPRKTLLAHLYYRFDPTWAVELRSHYGWDRPTEKDYLEYQADLTRWLRAGWKVRLTYQHKEDDDRVSIGIGLGARPPETPCFATPELAYGNR